MDKEKIEYLKQLIDSTKSMQSTQVYERTIAYVDDEIRQHKLDLCEPKSKFEEYILSLIQRKLDVLANYSVSPDKIKLIDYLEFEFCNSSILESILDGLRISRQNDKTPELILKLCSGPLLWTSDYIKIIIEQGVYLYKSAANNTTPLPDDHSAYQLIQDWSIFEPTKIESLSSAPNSINEYWPCDFSQFFISKSEIRSAGMFFSEFNYKSSYELELRKTVVRTYIKNGGFDFELMANDNLYLASKQSERELVLLGWMAAKGLRKGDKIVGYSQKSLWCVFQ